MLYLKTQAWRKVTAAWDNLKSHRLAEWLYIGISSKQWCIAKNRSGYTLNETPKASRTEPPKAARQEGNGEGMPSFPAD